MADDADLELRAEPPEMAATRGRWRGHTLRRRLTALERLPVEKRELAALMIRERHQTLRLMIAAAAIVMALGALIPIANARPKYRPARTEEG